MNQPTRTRARPGAAGFTLLEVMFALFILLFGLLGLMRLQIVGMNSNQGSRAHTTAVQLARELAAGLERLDFSDPRLDPTGVSGLAPPTVFGELLSGNTLPSTGYKTWDDASPVPGVRLDTAITDRDSDGKPTYQRRWTVWGYAGSAGAAPGGKVIAVSVTYHERALSIPFEVVYLTAIGSSAAAIANAAAFQ
jgi:type II secretory pathway pseudopilin PulG